MKILIACAYTPHRKGWSSEESLIQAFRDLGHEVITTGPVIGNLDGNITNEKRDIEVQDKAIHPETYTYKEILDRIEVKPDLILQIDPHFYFIGDKPNIPCAIYIVDAHRGANVFRDMAIAGKFDYVFVAHKYFIPHFERKNLKCTWLPRAYDDNYIKEYPEIDVQCDITFCGETGLHPDIEKFNCFDSEINLKYHDGPYPNVNPCGRYRSWGNHTMEYSERAEILIRLSRDFNLRVYEKAFGPQYPKTICRGNMVVNHSLWKDSALRNFEVMACRRNLITDYVPFQEELLHNYCESYNQYFLPFLSNFDLEYEEIKLKVENILNNESIRNYQRSIAYDYVSTFHTFKNRAQTIIDTVAIK